MRYFIFREEYVDECGLPRNCYGINAVNLCGKIVLRVDDITVDEEPLQSLIDNLNQSDVDLKSLKYVIEDFLFDISTLTFKSPFSTKPA